MRRNINHRKWVKLLYLHVDNIYVKKYFNVCNNISFWILNKFYYFNYFSCHLDISYLIDSFLEFLLIKDFTSLSDFLAKVGRAVKQFGMGGSSSPDKSQ